ncbi:hypothetical protein [Curtobacterium flaccumfaciens]|uniref:hypothetical protein n=1 Tax=Curtobacterium flaccumfaciens TaxID=2035 RepID=UPI003879DB17
MTRTMPNPALPQNAYQTYRSARNRQHDIKVAISGLTAERACMRKPVKHNNNRIGLQLREYKTGKRRARLTQLQHSNAYTCPIAHERARLKHQRDASYLAEQHIAAGGSIIFGTFTLRTKQAHTPPIFSSPDERFRASDAYDLANSAGLSHKELNHRKRTAREAFLEKDSQPASWEGWDLYERLNALEAGVKGMFYGKAWTIDQKKYGKVIGRLLAVEIVPTPLVGSDGRRNWRWVSHNAHIHFALFLESGEALTAPALNTWKKRLYTKWSKATRACGFSSTLSAQHLVQVSPSSLDAQRVSEYVAKGVGALTNGSLGLEETSSAVSIFQALTDAEGGALSDDGSSLILAAPGAKRWWQNLEGAVRGKQMFRISNPLQKLYGLAEQREQWEEEFSETIESDKGVAFFDRGVWFLITAESPEVKTELMTVAENLGIEGARDWLQNQGIAFFISQIGEADDDSASVLS